jgi:ATP-dependent Clp protease ATP-binding subunit ClpA
MARRTRAERDGHFTKRARHAIELSLDEAKALGHETLNDAHLLLGLFQVRGLAARVLRRTGLDLARSRAALRTSAGPASPSSEERLPLAPDLKRALQIGLHEAMERCSPGLDVEHLVIGVFSVDGVAGRVARAQGADPESVIAELQEELPPTYRPDGIENLENRLRVLDAYLLATERRDELLRITGSGTDREALVEELGRRFGFTTSQSYAVMDMPLDMLGPQAAIEAERHDLKRRLDCLAS